MLAEDQQRSLVELSTRGVYDLVAAQPDKQPQPFTFGLNSTTSPATDPPMIMQRADEVNTLLRMLSDGQTVIITGSPGAGKSTLAALLFHRLQETQRVGRLAPRHLLWLGLGSYTTVPDMIAAILQGIGVQDPGFFLLKPEQQISALLRALRRSQESALIVLDQFESLLHPETNQGVAGRGLLSLFLQMLQEDLGTSRILLTSYDSPFEEPDEDVETGVRVYMVSRISMPEGVSLLQQRGVQGSPEEVSLIWQRCAGHVFALVLFSTLVKVSGISLSYLLNSPDYQPMWSGEVTWHLITAVHHFLKPFQHALLRVLGLFQEPVPLEGLIMTVIGKLAGVGPEYSVQFEQELQVLMQLALVQQVVDASGVVRYILHPMLRQYVVESYPASAEQVGKPGASGSNSSATPKKSEALAAGHAQAASYYLYVMQTQCLAQKHRRGPQDVEAIILAIRHLCQGWRWQRACELLFEEGLHKSMVQWGAWNALIGLYTALLPPFGVLQRRDEALVASLVALLYGRMGESKQSQAYFEQALAIQRQIGDVRGEATTLLNQGELLRLHGERERARQNFEQAVALTQQQPDLSLKGSALHNLGLISHEAKDYQAAFNYYAQALKLSYAGHGQQNKGTILTNLGMLFYEQGLQKEPLAVLLAALQLRQEEQDPTVAMLEHFLSTLEHKMGSAAYAHLCQEAMEMQPQVLSRFMP